MKEKQELVGMMQQCRDCGPCGCERGRGCSCAENVTWKICKYVAPKCQASEIVAVIVQQMQ